MKIKMPHRRWDRIKRELRLIKLPQKINYKGDIKGNYCLPFYNDEEWDYGYPRFHFESKFIHRQRTDIDIHIDWIKHKEADGFHDLITHLVARIEKIR